MAAPIGPGDWVECIRTHEIRDDSRGFQTGALYCVAEIDPPTQDSTCEGCDGQCLGLRLIGMPDPAPDNLYWSGCAFRPIYRPKADLIESLKAPPIKAPARTREAA